MTDITASSIGAARPAGDHPPSKRPALDAPLNPIAAIIFFGLLAAGVLFMAYSLYVDVSESGMKTTTVLPYLLLFVALLIALGFEFVNGFHDTANAVATVIYTHSLPANIAVVWAGVFNFFGVVAASGAVRTGAQAHFYLETMSIVAIPGMYDQMTIHSSTQNPNGDQNNIARALGFAIAAIEADDELTITND